jgi:hypothetical protein
VRHSPLLTGTTPPCFPCRLHGLFPQGACLAQAVPYDKEGLKEEDFAKGEYMKFGKPADGAPLAEIHPMLKTVPKPYQLQVASFAALHPSSWSFLELLTSRTCTILLQGVDWMIKRESGNMNGRGFLHLHPCWVQLVTLQGLVFYVNRWPPHALSLQFFPAVSETRCGGFLCDEVSNLAADWVLQNAECLCAMLDGQSMLLTCIPLLAADGPGQDPAEPDAGAGQPCAGSVAR